MISYEIALGMSTVAVLLLAGNVTLADIVARQQSSVFTWNVFPLGLAYFIFTVAAFAETNRLPFDLPEAEGELIAGYHTEYSAMKFSMFYIAEYANMVTASALMATLFFGGWDIPFTHWDDAPPWTVWKTLATVAVFTVKVICFLFLYIWVRWTLPRFRYDQLMALGWKVMLPLALGYVALLATAIWTLHEVLGWTYDARFALALHSGALLTKEAREQMFARQRTRDGKLTGYGLGWAVGAERRRRREVYHIGGQPRVSTVLYVLPDSGVAVVLLAMVAVTGEQRPLETLKGVEQQCAGEQLGRGVRQRRCSADWPASRGLCSVRVGAVPQRAPGRTD